jgi:hypothetical protein
MMKALLGPDEQPTGKSGPTTVERFKAKRQAMKRKMARRRKAPS